MKKPIYRFLVNWYQASDTKLPAWLERACQQDASLAAEKSFGDQLTRELKNRPNDNAAFEGGNMAARVLKQITEEDYLAAQEQGATPARGAWVKNAGMAFAALAVVAAGYQFLNTGSDVGGEVAVVEETLATDGLLEIPADWKNPLDQEVEYIVSDAKGALGFLAATFVPSSYLQEDDNA